MPHSHYGWYTPWLEVLFGCGTAYQDTSYLPRFGVSKGMTCTATDWTWCVTLNFCWMAVRQEWYKRVSPRDNFYLPPLTLCCHRTNLLHQNTTESQPYINHGPHLQLWYEKFT